MDNGTLIALISIGVTMLFMLGVPIFLVIGFWVVLCSFVLELTLDNIGVALSDVFTDGFALLAMPLFILTGDLIAKSGIARRLPDFAYACLGWLRGGLAMASLGHAAVRGHLRLELCDHCDHRRDDASGDGQGGYDERFAAATAASGGTVGIIIPPSIIFIVYGFLMNLPISDLFVGGIIPGALMVIGMQVACWIVCTRNGWGHLIPLQMTRVLKTALGSWLGFFAIGLVLWGHLHGQVFADRGCRCDSRLLHDRRRPLAAALQDVWICDRTATRIEDKSFSEMVLVEGFKVTEIPSVVIRSAQITGILAPMIAISVVMQQILSLLGAKETIEAFVTGMGGYYAVLFTAMAIVSLPAWFLRACPIRSSWRRSWLPLPIP